MTTSRYLIARLAQAFGYFRRSQRLGDAASEMHLLREAETQLGAAVWESVEGIEALSVEYWNLRKLIKERDLITAKLAAYQESLNRAHEQRAILLNSIPEINQELLDERTGLLAELEQHTSQRDHIVAAAREIRRAYVGLKMKLEVLTKETTGSVANQTEITTVKSRLTALKHRFAELKQERLDIGLLIGQDDAKIDAIDEKLTEHRQGRRGLAASAFQIIGENNREISIMRAECGLLDTKLRQLYGEIGRYVSRHAQHDPLSAATVAPHQGLVDVMRALRRSISLNHRLAG